MSEAPLKQIPLQFKYVEGQIPTYVNAVIVNLVAEGVIVDFGFFDPFLIKEMQDSLDTGKEPEAATVQSAGRVILGHQLARQLITQIQNALDSAEKSINE
ncbi:MAG: hypothetical protein KME15_26370 [Drouetiella hepatica Uher 2000/2452]|jgi:hypothetical protein|uniref:Uncharacterized protein n=1 Tax=Drouetiella hepatica Uher 2000/2452 TaxID=904376 RepID=A0A951QJ54_9CYAN|nr:hypothetical protein [Drouetiella hepatica Uher 2000/2452]